MLLSAIILSTFIKPFIKTFQSRADDKNCIRKLAKQEFELADHYGCKLII